ncbi:sulfotransferase domain-containing protein [Nocardioides sp. SYSU DS0651]|uniref:sulfotransferase domain-containing protein n=1 Tax=Nocardioides sp. SYSU DS0651 TaxID=3415955 RepID=UPI003F4B8D0F
MAKTESGGVRELAAQVVQWNTPRAWIKYGVHAGARVRGAALARAGKVPEVANIFTAGSPKAGSQWMKALFHHRVVREHTGLFTLPQLDYQQRLDKPFPPGTFVPGIYLSYDEYRRLPRPWPHRTVYMFRDPRDLIVSGYYSAVKTHRKVHVPELEQFRDELRSMPREEGLLRLIREAAPRFEEIGTWVGVDDPSVATFRLEDNETDPEGQVRRMLEHCEVRLSPSELDAVVNEVSREALQARDIAQRGGGESHYRIDRKTYRELFGPEHHAAIEEVVPGLVARLGYPVD